MKKYVAYFLFLMFLFGFFLLFFKYNGLLYEIKINSKFYGKQSKIYYYTGCIVLFIITFSIIIINILCWVSLFDLLFQFFNYWY